jgi:hypothetical protein
MKGKTTKHKIRKRKLTIDFFEGNITKDMIDLASTPDGESFGIYPAPDGNGVTFGRPLDQFEKFGEGLPDPEGSRLDQWHLELDLRISFDSSTNVTYLEVARKESGTFHRFDLRGIDLVQAQKAAGKFNNLHEQFLINYGCFFLFQNLCWEQSDNPKAKQDAFQNSLKSFEYYFKAILKPRRFKEIEKETTGGVTITTLESVNGRPPGTKGRPRKLSERERNNLAERKPKIIEAMRAVTNNENKSELAHFIGISKPTFNNWLRNIGVKSQKDFYALIREAENE